MEIDKVMTRDVEYCSPDTPIHEVAAKMRDLDVGVMPICEDAQLTGLATDRDIILKAVADNTSMESPISEVMTTDPVRGTVHMTAEEAANLMADVQIRRLPIVEDGKMIGIVSLGDLAVTEKLDDEAGQALEDISVPSEPEK
ncbi:CBS domain-containing protein [Mesobacillus boroniphilus]|uniref:CBS domain-containing protein n=1 Tax=Mesobacillus boroniphilus TaxID=308892 RepID=A0A944CJL6_9BACI|nr:CBS domain-containing protein [Mesobacillus boroniphilus]MBS8264359.1 CBS domain-containing protein [Mesobacillus boroniphilus]